jgi:hypothetical protein
MVYSYYNAIIGTPFLRRHRINLEALQLPSLDLAELALPFLPVEVNAAVRASPSDRAPGPDGFGSAFLKVAWQAVGSDIVRVFASLWDLDFRNFNCLNEAYMVLLHKNSNPLGLRDYRPISLIHTVGKLFAKTLVLRLAPWMPALVSVNQTTLIKGRRIHKNFRTVQLICRWLHARRAPTVLLKVDLTKAFDTVAWPFLLEVMSRLGFPLRWRDWISYLLSTATTRVQDNGRPGRRIYHARGLRQGDPLSPLLFVLVMDVLNAMICEADRQGHLSPLFGSKIKFRASIYADDLVIFLAPEVHDFTCMRQILEAFEGASGLATNVDKCSITPIRCDDAMIADILQVFPCRVKPFPIPYLVAPLSTSKLSREHEQIIVNKVAARIPTWNGNLMTPMGRATLAKSTLSAIPVHTYICCALSPWAIKEIDRRRRAFIWAGADTVSGGKCKVTWSTVCMPKDLGGLGLPDLSTLGVALRLRWEWLRRSDPSAP